MAAVAAVIVAVIVAPATVALAAFIIALAVVAIRFLAIDAALVFDCYVPLPLEEGTIVSPSSLGEGSAMALFILLC